MAQPRRSRVILGLLGGYLAFQLLALGATVAGLTTRSGGFAFHRHPNGKIHAYPATPEAVWATERLGGQGWLIGVNGHRVEGDRLSPRDVDALIDVREGAINEFRLRAHDGREEEYRLPSGPVELTTIVSSEPQALLFPLVGLLYMALGVWVWWRRPNDRAAEPLLLFAFAPGLHLSLNLSIGPLARAVGDVSSIVPIFYAPGLLNFGLRFTGFYRYPRMRLVLRGVLACALALGGLRIYARVFDDSETLDALFRGSLAVLVVASILLTVGLSTAAARPPHPLGLRRRARVLAIATFVSFLFPSMTLLMPPLGGFMYIVLGLLACFPVLIGYAIVRLGMFDIRVVLGQSLLYVTLSVSVLLGYLGLVWVAVHVLGTTAEQPVMLGAALATSVVVLSLLQLRVQGAINRLVFRSRYLLGDALAEASDRLARAHSRSEVIGTARTALLGAMELSTAAVALREGSEPRLRCSVLGERADRVTGERRPGLPKWLDPERLAPVRRALQTADVVSAHDAQAVSAQLAAPSSPETKGPAPGDEAGFWPYYGLEWIIPLKRGRSSPQDSDGEPEGRDSDSPEPGAPRIAGLLLLGPKHNGRPLDSSDRALIATLANQLAVALDNADAFEQIRELKDHLEDQVEVRTRELRDTLADLRRTQSQLVESEKQAMLGRVVAGIVHEVNSPLGSLQSSVDTLDRLLSRVEERVTRLEAGADADADATHVRDAVRAGRTLLPVLREGGERIRGLLESLKRFVSLDESERKPVDVREGIESALTVLASSLGSRIAVVRNYPNDPPLVECHPARLNQVFLNLLENASRAIDGNGEIAISIERRLDRVNIEVRDNGCGIEAERIDDLFEFGFTSKQGRIRMRLGLPSNKRTVEEIGGAMSINSIAGQGTRVRVELPALR